MLLLKVMETMTKVIEIRPKQCEKIITKNNAVMTTIMWVRVTILRISITRLVTCTEQKNDIEKNNSNKDNNDNTCHPFPSCIVLVIHLLFVPTILSDSYAAGHSLHSRF